MKNVTITLDETLHAWARIEAAKSGQSLSRFVAQLLEERKAPDVARSLDTLDEFFSGPGWPGAAENWPSRDEIYDRPALLRRDRDRLRDRSERSWKAASEQGDHSQRALAEKNGGEPTDTE